MLRIKPGTSWLFVPPATAKLTWLLSSFYVFCSFLFLCFSSAWFTELFCNLWTISPKSMNSFQIGWTFVQIWRFYLSNWWTVFSDSMNFFQFFYFTNFLKFDGFFSNLVNCFSILVNFFKLMIFFIIVNLLQNRWTFSSKLINFFKFLYILKLFIIFMNFFCELMGFCELLCKSQ